MSPPTTRTTHPSTRPVNKYERSRPRRPHRRGLLVLFHFHASKSPSCRLNSCIISNRHFILSHAAARSAAVLPAGAPGPGGPGFASPCIRLRRISHRRRLAEHSTPGLRSALRRATKIFGRTAIVVPKLRTRRQSLPASPQISSTSPARTDIFPSKEDICTHRDYVFADPTLQASAGLIFRDKALTYLDPALNITSNMKRARLKGHIGSSTAIRS